MAKRKFQLTRRECDELQAEIDRLVAGKYRNRLEAVLAYGMGYPVTEICEGYSCQRSTLMNWCRAYQAEGLAGLGDRRQGGNNAYLTAWQLRQLKTRLTTLKPKDVFGGKAATHRGEHWTVEDLCKGLKAWYRVIYRTRKSYYQIMDEIGFDFDPRERVFRQSATDSWH